MSDFEAIVVGAGHNGLVAAAYLAQRGMKTLLVEARETVGGCAASEDVLGVRVNICNCDHLTFRTTPVIEELGLGAHGLHYLDVDPGAMNMAWSGGAIWPSFHSLERTLEGLRMTHPNEVDGYRRYAAAAMPAVRLILDAAAEPPSARRLIGKVLQHRGRGASTLLRWSRKSAADVMRSFFATDALQAPGMVAGPMVWGISPETPGTGLGALSYAMRHVSTVGRPIGGSGMVPISLQSAFLASGGTLRTSTRVTAINCASTGVAGITVDDGTEITAPIVVSACDPHSTFLSWLRNPPAGAGPLIDRWQATPHAEGYESKIDAAMTVLPVYKRLDPKLATQLDFDPLAATTNVAPSIADMVLGAAMMKSGMVLDRPAFFANIPTVLDPSMGTPGTHVLSLETLYTPYGVRGGWTGSTEPQRWIDEYATLLEPGWKEGISQWRVMTPDRYEGEFNLPKGHATSFAGGPLAALHSKSPELTRYRTPVDGLYITGAATFPGAGVWGASGRNCALTILARHNA